MEPLDIANRYKTTEKEYVIDELCSGNGHLVVRIPHYHCENILPSPTH